MTIIFQITAVLAIAVAAFVFLRAGGARHQAFRRILGLLFVLAAATSIFFPQAWTWVANLVGIGRGTDLLVYVLVLAFIGSVVTTFRRFRQIEAEMTALARKVALLEAPAPGGSVDGAGDVDTTDSDQTER